MHTSLQRAVSAALFILIAPGCAESMKQEEQALLENDERNELVTFDLSASSDTLRYCVEDVDGEASPADVFRILLQTSELLRERSFQTVDLCFRGESKFSLDGAYFQEVGKSFPDIKPLAVMGEIPLHLTLPNGDKAYTADPDARGLFGLVTANLENFSDMNDHWYLDEIRAEMQAEIESKRPKTFAKEEEIF